MIVYPTDILAKSISENRLEPMIMATRTLKSLYNKNESSQLELQFDGMYLSLAGSNSPSSLASKAIKYLFLDEVDKYPGSSKKESDPISLAMERTKTFRNRKIYMTSTPTLATGHIWKALMDADIEKHYFIPCPHCGSMIELTFQNLKFPSGDDLSNQDRADMAVYRCQECGGDITDQDKEQMLRYGEWKTVRENSKYNRKVGFWINTLYSPFVRFSEIVKEFLDSKDDPDKLQNFTNSWLAEPWEDTKLKTSADTVLERQTERPEFTAPSWTKFLTAGVDVQETSLYWTIRAWGSYITSQNIAHGQALSFQDIEQIMNTPYFTEDGDQLIVALCLIDSGYDADSTYDFCAIAQIHKRQFTTLRFFSVSCIHSLTLIGKKQVRKVTGCTNRSNAGILLSHFLIPFSSNFNPLIFKAFSRASLVSGVFFLLLHFFPPPPSFFKGK